MIEATRRKLDEARFFYGHLVKERERSLRFDPREFRFYFSAFIQAARSVTWTLGNEEPRGGANALVEWEVVALHELLVEPWKKPAAQQSWGLAEMCYPFGRRRGLGQSIVGCSAKGRIPR
jgi:hypothetical protein